MKIFCFLFFALFGSFSEAASYVPASFTTDFTKITSAASTVQSNAWALLIVVTATFVVVKLFKKGLSKAS
jgi:hypothetical protein